MRSYTDFILLLLLFLQGNGFAQKQKLEVHQLLLEDGLLHRKVNSVLMDDFGFVWVASAMGIQRFDGTDFKNWTQKEGKAIHSITSIGIDKSGWVWMWNQELEEFVFIHSNTEKILSQNERFKEEFPLIDQEGQPLWHPEAPLLRADSSGRFLFLVPKNQLLVIYDSKTGFSEKQLGWLDDDLASIEYCGKSDLWIAVHDQFPSKIYRCDQNGNLLLKLTLSERPYRTIVRSDKKTVEFIEIDDFQRKWKTVYDLSNGQMISEMPLNLDVQHILYQQGFKWVLEGDRWNVYQNEDSTIVASLSQQQHRQSLTEGIHFSHFDQKNRLWLAGEWGVSCLQLSSFELKKQLYFRPEEPRLYNNAIRGIHVLNDTVYASIEYHGIVAFEKAHPDAVWVVDGTFESNHLAYGAGPIIRSADGSLTIGSYGGISFVEHGIVRQETISSSSFPLQNEENGYYHGVWSLYEEPEGRLWVGSTHGLWLRTSTNNFEYYPVGNTKGHQNPIYQIEPRGEKNLLLLTQKGLYLFDKTTQQLEEVYVPKKSDDSFRSGADIHFYCMLRIDSSHYIFGTSAGALFWNSQNGQCFPFTTEDGLSGNHVYTLVKDHLQNYWLATNNGLTLFNNQHHQLKIFQEKDGITHPEFNRISSFKESDGTIYFGGLNGITVIDPSHFDFSNQEQKRLEITDFEIYSGSQNTIINRTGLVRKNKEIIFHPNDRYFKLRFAIPEWKQNGQALFAWRLKGVDTKWNYQKENVLQLTALPYGDHLLQIKGKSASGNWSEILDISIKSLKPFYLRSWFIITNVCFLLLSVFLFLKWRTRQLRKRQLQLQEEIILATAQIRRDKELIEQQSRELQVLDETKSRFFANVTHELRTPLTLILGPIDSSIRAGGMDSNRLQLLQTARKNAKSLLQLIGSLLDLSKLESGKMTVQGNNIHLHSFLKYILVDFERLCEASGLTLDFQYELEPDLKVELDKVKLQTILNNLLSNAIKFTAEGGKIGVVLTSKGEQLEFEVSDTGRGIHPDDLPHVFQRFYQSTLPAASAEGGTGIGLALSNEFAKIMGGSLHLKSVLDKGSSFILRLPLLTVDQAELADEEVVDQLTDPIKSIVKSSPEHKKRILIVEDHPDLRNYLISILGEDYEVLEAPNGKKAIQKLDQLNDRNPDLIISDIMMPEMDGYQLLEKLKSDDRYWKIPVIMLTARARLEDKLKALRIGVDDYLLKPFEEEELKVRIANLLRHAMNRKSETEEPTDTGLEPLMPEKDRLWLEKVEQFVFSKMEDENFTVADLSKEFAMSQSTFQRQIRKLTGLNPNEYIREHKLSLARTHLEKSNYASVAEVAYAVGYKDAKAFSRSFKDRFGKSPSYFFQ